MSLYFQLLVVGSLILSTMAFANLSLVVYPITTLLILFFLKRVGSRNWLVINGIHADYRTLLLSSLILISIAVGAFFVIELSLPEI